MKAETIRVITQPQAHVEAMHATDHGNVHAGVSLERPTVPVVPQFKAISGMSFRVVAPMGTRSGLNQNIIRVAVKLCDGCLILNRDGQRRC